MGSKQLMSSILFPGCIVVDPDIRSGVPVIRGTRVSLAQILIEVASGVDIIEIADDLDIDLDPIREFFESLSELVSQPFTPET